MRRFFPMFYVLCSMFYLPVAVGYAEETVQFVNVTKEAGIRFRYVDGASGQKYLVEPLGSGAAFFDYDNDGYLDLYFVNGAPLPGFQSEVEPRNALYRNKGPNEQGVWTFTDVTEEAGVGDTGYGYAVKAGDYDNDGDMDLYVTNFGPNVFYRNNGDGTFTDITAEAGVGDARWGTDAAFLDYDADGYVDLYVGNYVDFSVARNKVGRAGPFKLYALPRDFNAQPDVLYRNRGDGTFEDVTRAAGVYISSGKAMGIVAGDYDNDGDLDLYVANDTVPKFLYRNNGDGTFTEVGLMAGVAYSGEGRVQSGMAADFGDYDNDGDLDLLVTTYQRDYNVLYRNEGNGFFSDVSFQAGIARASLRYLAFSAGFFDYDHDGDLDVFIANGHLEPEIHRIRPGISYAQTNQVFRNNGDGTFTDVSAELGPGMQEKAVSRGMAFGDYDNDGDLDVLVANRNGLPELLRNEGGNRKRWLMIRTIGRVSNRDGIGARITVTSGDLRQIREVRSSAGLMSQHDMRVHFGLGEKTSVDLVEIRWPSGIVQTLKNVSVDRVLTVEEPKTRGGF